MKKLDITGRRFGKLIAIKTFNKGNKRTYWLCKCDCGNFTTPDLNALRRKSTISCGCWLKEITKKGIPHFKHGMEGTRFYGIWSKILRRLRNKNCQEYKYYGGRNITICSEWLDFRNFYNDMFPDYCDHCYHFGEKNTTIERIDSNGNYNTENCRWATWEEQGNNRRNNIFITYNGNILTIKQWARKLNINYLTLYTRLKILNWTIERAFNTPTRHKN